MLLTSGAPFSPKHCNEKNDRSDKSDNDKPLGVYLVLVTAVRGWNQGSRDEGNNEGEKCR